MFKRWLRSSSSAWPGEHRSGSAGHALALMGSPEMKYMSGVTGSVGNERGGIAPSDDCADFEQIYQGFGVKPPTIPGGILKVVEMVNSQHLSGLTPEARRCAVLMALETVGAEIEDLLQDALVRQRALNEYESNQREKLQRFEEGKAEENRGLQAELDRLTNQYMARLQANLDQVAHEQDGFHAWQRKKQQESQRINEAAAFCVPETVGPHGGSLTAVLERACVGRR